MSESLSVGIAGATGWTGPALVRGVLDAPDLSLRSAVSRSAAGRDLGEALDGDALGVAVFGTVSEALDGIDVLVDYTSATAVKANVMAAIDAGVGVSSAVRASRRATSPRSTRRPARVRSAWWPRATSR